MFRLDSTSTPWLARAPLAPLGLVLAAAVSCGDGLLESVCAPGQSARCACPHARIGTRTCLEDGSGFSACDCGVDGPELYAELRELAAQYPELLELRDYGDSADKDEPGGWAGCDLLAVKVGPAAHPATEPAVVVAAGYHGNELVGPDMALRFLRWLAAGYGEDAVATWLVSRRAIWVIPTVNPDSLGIRRANANLVDLNRNHSFHWTPGAEHGAAPASEPEVQALEHLLSDILIDQRAADDYAAAGLDTSGIFLTLHGPFAKVLWPWGFTGLPAPNADDLAAVGRHVARPTGYEVGQSHEQLYAMPGSATDWAYGTFGVPALLVEIGPSNNATPSTMEAETWPMMKQVLRSAATIASAPYELARGPMARLESIAPVAATTRIEVTLDDTASGDDPIASATAHVSAPPWQEDGPARQLAAVDGALDSSVELVAGSLSIDLESCREPPNPLLIVQGTDAAGHRGPVALQWLCR